MLCCCLFHHHQRIRRLSIQPGGYWDWIFPFAFALSIWGGTGAGDVKLLGAVGSFLGPKGVFTVFIISCILSGVYALFLLASKGLLTRTLKRYGKILWTFIYNRQLVFIKPSLEEKQIKVRHGLSIALGTGSYLAFWI